VAGRPYFRGPDVFYVGGVPPVERKAWVSWEEGDRLPDVIVELLSPSTAKIDRTVKKDLYGEVWHTPEYFLYERETHTLEGFRLSGGTYRPIPPNAAGRLPSEELNLELGFWEGEKLGVQTTWLRLFDAEGRLVPTLAEAQGQRADTAEAELARLRALLAERSGQS
jgi:Uma2 family endonuclease